MHAIGWTAAALLLQQAPAATAPLQPTGKWQVAFEESLCAMSRPYGAAEQGPTLAFRPFPMNDRAEVAIVEPRGKNARRDGAAEVAFAPGRTLPASFSAFGTAQGVRVVHVYLDRSLLHELAGAESVTIRADNRSYAFAVPKAASALKVLDQCETSLLQQWGVDPALKTGALAKLRGNPSSYFSPADYPTEALRAEHRGRAVALLAVSAGGSVSSCRIVESSGAPTLDTETCRIAQQRLRFDPALDAAGKPVASQYLLPVRWQL
jgi:TonB family protein